MLRKCTMGFLIILFFLLQTTVLRIWSLASITPNLLLILVFEFGFIRGQKAGIWMGFFCGFILDIYYGDVIGFYALLYMLMGYLNGFFHAMFYDEDITLPLVLVSASNIIYGFMVYVLRFLLQNRLDFPYYLYHVIMPEAVYTVLIAVIIYRPLLWLNRVLETVEKRSASKFG